VSRGGGDRELASEGLEMWRVSRWRVRKVGRVSKGGLAGGGLVKELVRKGEG